MKLCHLPHGLCCTIRSDSFSNETCAPRYAGRWLYMRIESSLSSSSLGVTRRERERSLGASGHEAFGILDEQLDWMTEQLASAVVDRDLEVAAMLERGDAGARFGRGGKMAGQFDWVHNIAVDSKGTVYTSEVNTAKRVQKFNLVRS